MARNEASEIETTGEAAATTYNPWAQADAEKREYWKKKDEERKQKRQQEKAARSKDEERRQRRRQEKAAESKDEEESYYALVADADKLDQFRLPEHADDPPKTQRRLHLEKLLKVRNKQGRTQELTLNRCQLEADNTAGRRNIILKARQVGVTTYVAARFFLATIARPGTLSVQVAHDQQSAEQIFRIVHRFLDNLPEAWRKGTLKTSRANVRQIVFPKLDSEYRVETAADPSAGRGLTIQNLHCSEVSRWPRDVAETLASLRAAVPPDGEIFLESTPEGASGTFYEEWQSAPDTGYVRHFYPWWWEPSYRRDNVEIVNFTEEEHELMAKHGLDAGQIAYRREVRANFRFRARAEYAENPETCFLTSGNCVFDCEALDKKLKQQEPMIDSRQNGRLLYFLQPQPGRDYVIGVDPSSGDPNGDYSCIQVIDRVTGAQCAEWHGHYRPEEIACNAVELGKQYNFAMIAVERNGLGLSVISHIGVHTDYCNMYRKHDVTGWTTSEPSRHLAVTTLEAELAHNPGAFVSHRLLQECRTFVRKAGGRCEAAAGAHDDCVMAMAIALAVRGEVHTVRPETKQEAEWAALKTA